MKKFLVRFLLVMTVTSLALTSCKAWRTISTTATCTQLSDSTKTTTTISTKTVEEYQGVKK
jgi:hypothetical protein